MMIDAQPTLRDAISALKSEIDSLEIELSAKRMAYKTLMEIAGHTQEKTVQKDGRVNPESLQEKPQIEMPNGIIDLNDLTDETAVKKRTLIDDAREVVARFGGQEFNLSHVDVALKRHGVRVDGKSPKSRISTALVRLCREEFLVRTYTGVGNVPNRYRVRSTMSEPEIAQALAQNPLPAESTDL
jgi:hypothetical protein